MLHCIIQKRTEKRYFSVANAGIFYYFVGEEVKRREDMQLHFEEFVLDTLQLYLV